MGSLTVQVAGLKKLLAALLTVVVAATLLTAGAAPAEAAACTINNNARVDSGTTGTLWFKDNGDFPQYWVASKGVSVGWSYSSTQGTISLRVCKNNEQLITHSAPWTGTYADISERLVGRDGIGEWEMQVVARRGSTYRYSSVYCINNMGDLYDGVCDGA
jgi:hypothetical protein